MHNYKEYLTINEILKRKLSTLTTSRLNKLCKKLQVIYPQQIIGGGQGRRYRIHFSILNMVTRKRNSKMSIKELEDKAKENVDRNLFNAIKWKFFITINPKFNLNEDQLKEIIPDEYYRSIFYGIHTRPFTKDQMNHIHLAIDTDVTAEELRFIINKRVKVVEEGLIIKDYDQSFSSTYDYLINRDKFKNNSELQVTIDYGFKRGVEVDVCVLG